MTALRHELAASLSLGRIRGAARALQDNPATAVVAEMILADLADAEREMRAALDQQRVPRP